MGNCQFLHVDGAGAYCKAIDVKMVSDVLHLGEYMHKYWRCDCYGDFDRCMCRTLWQSSQHLDRKRGGGII